MNISIPRAMRIPLLTLGVVLFPASACLAQDSPAGAGVLWEVTSQMTMEGMPYSPPAQTVKRCMHANWTAPPDAGDEDRGCVTSEFERFENTVTWTSSCAGPPEMAGRGEIVFEDDSARAYTGKLIFSSDEGNVVINLGGKVVGTCPNPH